MPTMYKRLICWAAVLIMVAVMVACKSGDGDQGEKLNGRNSSTIRVSGAWALYPMMVRWAEEYKKVHPESQIDVSAGGAGKGIADTLAGLVDIGMVSRDIKAEEAQKGAWHIPVAKDAVFPIMNADNPALKTALSRGVMRKNFLVLWIKGKELTWGQLTGGAFADRVRVYTRSDACGAAEVWAKYLGNHKQEDLRGVAVYGDPGVTEAVRKDIRGIGYNNLNYAYDMKTGLPQKGIRIVPLDVNENGRIDPEEDLSTKEKAIRAVIAGGYPSPPARDLHLVVKGKLSGPSKDFIQWILTDGQQFVGEVGYIKVADKQIREALAKVGQ